MRERKRPQRACAFNLLSPMISLVPSVYDATTGAGDFGRMIRDAAYADALFIYNVNLA